MTNAFAQLETTRRVIKRAQYEAFEFELQNTGIRVRNCSHADPTNHEYHVTIEGGIPVACECPAEQKYPSACKHRVAVAIRTPLLEAATSQAVTDGGAVTLKDESEDEEEGDDCDCEHLESDFPCWECYRTGKRDLPE